MNRPEKSWLGAAGQLVWRNWITLFGSSLTTVSAVAILVFMVMTFVGVPLSPYIGLLTYLLLPAVFVLGLLIIPLGAWWDRRRRRALSGEEPAHIKLDFNSPRIQRLAVIVGFLTAFNFMLVSLISYEGAVYMESVAFCGTTCHTVMEPEFTAHMNSPHAMVKCVDCHIGPGVPALIHAKLNGLNQVYGVLTGSYETPIPVPVHGLAQAEETCGECHNPEMDLGAILKVTTDYSADENNTPLKSVLLMHVGGRGASSPGIHSWHLAPGREIRYFSTDGKREEIGYVRSQNPDGSVTEYYADGFSQEGKEIPEEKLRQMDCTDCHNRATHRFKMPGPALNEALDEGRIDKTLPSVKMVGLEALEGALDAEDATLFIQSHLEGFYAENHGEIVAERAETLDAAIRAIQDIYRKNIFPAMEIGWGSYPDHNGHTQFDGCFRCHDDGHSSRDGANIISQDCTSCHNVVTWQEENPEILGVLGLQ